MAARTTDAPPWLTARVWAALHGLAELQRAERVRPGEREARVALVCAMLAGAAS